MAPLASAIERAARRILADGVASRILVVDCDVHQGNGTAAIFRDEPRVVTFSIHQENNYPTVKPPSDVDVGLRDRATGAEYLAALGVHLPGLLERTRADVVFYVAGADPFEEDQLGGLALTLDDLEARDRYVISSVRTAGAAVAAAGGRTVGLAGWPAAAAGGAAGETGCDAGTRDRVAVAAGAALVGVR